MRPALAVLIDKNGVVLETTFVDAEQMGSVHIIGRIADSSSEFVGCLRVDGRAADPSDTRKFKSSVILEYEDKPVIYTFVEIVDDKDESDDRRAQL